MAKKTAMTSNHYRLIATCICQIEDVPERKRTADHFASFFHNRSPSFDNQAWFTATGGIATPPTPKGTPA